MPRTPYVLLDDQKTGQQLYFQNPSALIEASRPEEVPAAFAQIERALAQGQYLAGYFAYKLGFALEPKLAKFREAAGGDLPLIQLGVFGAPSDHPPADLLYTRNMPKLEFTPEWTEADYLSRFEKVQKYLRAGDCYQVNLTFPMQATTDASPAEIFASFRQKQPGRYGALMELGETALISFSPELFFEKTGAEMRMRPMKGTRPRAAGDDTQIARDMQSEPKSRAENLMIVDLLRNDLSRLCQPGSVKVPELFALEAYPTLYQMTSEVRGTLRSGLKWAEIFKGLFPCGSVTGAPKIRAMEIIQELETRPRGAYCGALGYFAPNGDACFNVGIRTATLRGGALQYDVGSGVVIDSDGPDEYRECLLKSRILDAQTETLIETFLQTEAGDFQNLDAHLARLKAACKLRNWPYPAAQIKKRLGALRAGVVSRIRLTVDAAGHTEITQAPFTQSDAPLRLAISRYALTNAHQRFDVKTSRRSFYDGERARLAAKTGCDEVLFFNVQGQLCEGSFTSVFLEMDGALFTPTLASGLLPGILRAQLIDSSAASEKVLTRADLERADKIWLGNSLRGLCLAALISPQPQS